MVVCNSCRNVVWAYDHEHRAIAGICNMLSLPCGICGAVGNFDGWDGDLSWLELHVRAEQYGYAWSPDGSNRWFRPDSGTAATIARQAASIERLRAALAGCIELLERDAPERHPPQQYDGEIAAVDYALKDARAALAETEATS